MINLLLKAPSLECQTGELGEDVPPSHRHWTTTQGTGWRPQTQSCLWAKKVNKFWLNFLAGKWLWCTHFNLSPSLITPSIHDVWCGVWTGRVGRYVSSRAESSSRRINHWCDPSSQVYSAYYTSVTRIGDPYGIVFLTQPTRCHLSCKLTFSWIIEVTCAE